MQEQLKLSAAAASAELERQQARLEALIEDRLGRVDAQGLNSELIQLTERVRHLENPPILPVCQELSMGSQEVRMQVERLQQEALRVETTLEEHGVQLTTCKGRLDVQEEQHRRLGRRLIGISMLRGRGVDATLLQDFPKAGSSASEALAEAAQAAAESAAAATQELTERFDLLAMRVASCESSCSPGVCRELEGISQGFDEDADELLPGVVRGADSLRSQPLAEVIEYLVEDEASCQRLSDEDYKKYWQDLPSFESVKTTSGLQCAGPKKVGFCKNAKTAGGSVPAVMAEQPEAVHLPDERYKQLLQNL